MYNKAVIKVINYYYIVTLYYFTIKVKVNEKYVH